MGKLIFYVILAILAYWIINSHKIRKEKKETPLEPIEDMVSCTYCGIHLPKSEAVSDRNRYFCCNEHCHQHNNSST